jgi:hypothetical protein
MNRRAQVDCLNHIIAAGVCIVILCGFLAVSPACFHWFVLPVFAAGVIASGEILKWARSGANMFSPAGLVAVAAFYTCFLTPMIHVAVDSWMAYIVPPDDWRPWLGIMGVVNSIGLLLYKAVLYRRTRRASAPPSHWTINHGRFTVFIAAAILLSGLVHMWMMIQLGGYQGMLSLFRTSIRTGEDAMAGWGWAAAIGESLPMLLVLAYAVVARRERLLRTWPCLAGFLASTFALQIAIGGYRGSRGNTVWVMIWAVGIIHLWLRRIPQKFMWLCLAGMCLFMYVSGFYKAAGTEGLDAISDSNARQYLEDRSGRTVTTLLLGDLDRSDTQAFTVYSQLSYGADPALGRTYLGTAALLIPQELWPDRPPSKVKWTTETEYGKGSYPFVRSSRIYGLTGETMLNFGLFGAPLGFLVLGWLVRRVEGMLSSLHPSDSRVLTLPLFVLLCVLALMFDTDNLLWVLVKHGGLPLIVIAASSRRIACRTTAMQWVPSAAGVSMPARSY